MTAPQQTAAEADFGKRVRNAVDPLCEDFANDLRAVVTALSQFLAELEQEGGRRDDAELLEALCWVIDRKADEIDNTVEGVIKASYAGSAKP
jgi:hypothetical protein